MANNLNTVQNASSNYETRQNCTMHCHSLTAFSLERSPVWHHKKPHNAKVKHERLRNDTKTMELVFLSICIVQPTPKITTKYVFQ